MKVVDSVVIDRLVAQGYIVIYIYGLKSLVPRNGLMRLLALQKTVLL